MVSTMSLNISTITSCFHLFLPVCLSLLPIFFCILFVVYATRSFRSYNLFSPKLDLPASVGGVSVPPLTSRWQKYVFVIHCSYIIDTEKKRPKMHLPPTEKVWRERVVRFTIRRNIVREVRKSNWIFDYATRFLGLFCFFFADVIQPQMLFMVVIFIHSILYSVLSFICIYMYSSTMFKVHNCS